MDQQPNQCSRTPGFFLTDCGAADCAQVNAIYVWVQSGSKYIDKKKKSFKHIMFR